MLITKGDLTQAENVAKALRRGKFELDGEEVLAFSQAFSWVNRTIEKMKEELASLAKPEEPKEPTKIGGKKK